MPLSANLRRPALGTIYFVGAGPGDPKLITLKGARLLKKADCVLYDRLVDPKLLRLSPKRCQRIYVGKESDQGGKGQRKINQLLIQKARSNRVIVRLKGGDPTLFGRITEEIKGLAERGIPFEVVPGVSSVWAAAASAGIPLTDRVLSSSVTLVTGQEASGKRPSVKWEKLALSVDTLVTVMGRARLPSIVRRLIRGGIPPSTPVALIRSVTTPQEEILISTLEKLQADLKRRLEFGPPVVAVIGRVVNRRKELFQGMEGKRILITRPYGDSAELADRLKKLGAKCVHLPTIVVKPRAIPLKQGKALLAELPRYHWILFTSHHGVRALEKQANRIGSTLPSLLRGKICAIGPRTQVAAKQAGLRVDLLPEEFSTDGIKKAFRSIPVSGKRILIPRSNLGRGDKLARFLRARGALVKEWVLYETHPTKPSRRRIKRVLRGLDVLTFTSASTVRGFSQALKEAGLTFQTLSNGTKVVAIGPATAQALRDQGISQVYLPKGDWTIEGMVKAIQEACC